MPGAAEICRWSPPVSDQRCGMAELCGRFDEQMPEFDEASCARMCGGADPIDLGTLRDDREYTLRPFASEGTGVVFREYHPEIAYRAGCVAHRAIFVWAHACREWDRRGVSPHCETIRALHGFVRAYTPMDATLGERPQALRWENPLIRDLFGGEGRWGLLDLVMRSGDPAEIERHTRSIRDIGFDARALTRLAAAQSGVSAVVRDAREPRAALTQLPLPGPVVEPPRRGESLVEYLRRTRPAPTPVTPVRRRTPAVPPVVAAARVRDTPYRLPRQTASGAPPGRYVPHRERVPLEPDDGLYHLVSPGPEEGPINYGHPNLVDGLWQGAAEAAAMSRRAAPYLAALEGRGMDGRVFPEPVPLYLGITTPAGVYHESHRGLSVDIAYFGVCVSGACTPGEPVDRTATTADRPVTFNMLLSEAASPTAAAAVYARCDPLRNERRACTPDAEAVYTRDPGRDPDDPADDRVLRFDFARNAALMLALSRSPHFTAYRFFLSAHLRRAMSDWLADEDHAYLLERLARERDARALRRSPLRDMRRAVEDSPMLSAMIGGAALRRIDEAYALLGLAQDQAPDVVARLRSLVRHVPYGVAETDREQHSDHWHLDVYVAPTRDPGPVQIASR